MTFGRDIILYYYIYYNIYNNIIYIPTEKEILSNANVTA